MLEVRGTIKARVAKGVNVKALHEEGTTRKQTAQGVVDIPNSVPTYTDGKPFGAVIGEILAPINLEAGDVLVVDANDGSPLRVMREVRGKDGEVEAKEVYTSDLQKEYRRLVEVKEKRMEERG